MSDHDDFWGDTPDWTSETPRPRRSFGIAERRQAMVDRLSARRRAPRDEVAHADDVDGRHVHGVHDAAGHFEPTELPTTAHVEIDVDIDAEPVDARHTRPSGGVDPLLARFGTAAVVLTLMVPLALNLASSDGIDESVVAEASLAPTTIADAQTGGAVLATTGTPASADDGAGSGTEATTYLDPADLPPAVPVNDVDDEPDLAARSADTDTAPRQRGDSATAQTDAVTGDDTADDIDTSADADDQADRLRVPCPIDFTVRSGDFWIGLADDADVDLSALLDINDASVDTPLYPGSEICLPSGATIPTAATTTTIDSNVTTGSESTDTTTPPATSPPTTTATTTTTTTTTTIAPVAPVGPEEVTSIIRDVWPDELEERALEIAYRESRYVPTAKNFCCYGLFQIYWTVHQGWLADLGITSAEQLYDPETNARAAYALYQRAGGWGPWSL